MVTRRKHARGRFGPPIQYVDKSGDPNRDKIIELRKKLQLTQEELGAKLGVSSVAIGSYEHGTRKPPKPLLMLIDALFPEAPPEPTKTEQP